MTEMARPIIRCVAALFLLATVSDQPSVAAETFRELVQSAAARVAPSVVRIRTVGKPGVSGQSLTSQVTTGVVISNDGEVLTSLFGFEDQVAAVLVEDADGQQHSADVVAIDHVRKLVLLKCATDTLTPVPQSPSEDAAVGATAIALGRFYPTDMPSFSVGIVSAVGRIHGLALQTDASVSPVNYGGPLIDLSGRVLGIIVPLSPQDTEGISAGVEWYDSGIGFCIPFADAMRQAELLRKGEDLVRGIVGVALSTRNPLEETVEVLALHPESPGAQADLQKGDIIIQAQGVDVERYGRFESIVKRSYAGDVLRLKIRRGDETLAKELLLTDHLDRPERGYLGVIPVERDSDEADDDDQQISLRVLPGSPAAQAGLPDRAVVQEWNGQVIEDLKSLQRRLQALTVGTAVKITWHPADADGDSGEPRELELTPVQREASVIEIPAAVVESVAGTAGESEWKQSELPLGDSGNLRLYAPETRPQTPSGLLLLLSVSAEPVEVVIQRWEAVCRQHNLLLAVPVPEAAEDLTREHLRMIQQAFTAVAKERPLDARRVVLVTQEPQASLCVELLQDRRMPVFRTGVFEECWPRVTEQTAAALARNRVSVLVQPAAIRSRQQTALEQQALATLKESGTRVTRVEADDSAAAIPQQTGNWVTGLLVY